MFDLNEVVVFTRVAQEGSFTKAARALGMPVSTVSRKVSQLEERLGVSLIQRTTRKLSMTDVGDAYLRECAKVLAGFEAAESAAVHSRSEPQGLLRVTAPAEMGAAGSFLGLVDEFLKKNPKVTIDLLLTDRIVDLVGEGIDVAVRGGELDDSTLIARKIHTSVFSLFASPAYLKKNGVPSTPDDLVHHNCLRFTALDDPSAWELVGPKGKKKVRVSGNLMSNHILAIRDFAVEGRGIALLPEMSCAHLKKKGSLKDVLPDWSTEKSALHLLYPAQRFVPPKIHEFVEHLAKGMRVPNWLELRS